jgi:ubiquinone/menaquinone biosynthesis C-methylase UbiE
MLDCGAFLGAAARMAATRAGARAVAADLTADFLAAGRELPGGAGVRWVVADNRRLPFPDGAFDSVWALDTLLAPRELSRVAAAHGATLCLSCDAPTDGRGGGESFLDEWRALGWTLAWNRQTGGEAAHAWRIAEQELAGRRKHFESLMGRRNYQSQLDELAYLVEVYDHGQLGHGLFVLRR